MLSKAKAISLPHHRPYVCAIDLLSTAPWKKCLIYLRASQGGHIFTKPWPLLCLPLGLVLKMGQMGECLQHLYAPLWISSNIFSLCLCQCSISGPREKEGRKISSRNILLEVSWGAHTFRPVYPTAFHLTLSLCQGREIRVSCFFCVLPGIYHLPWIQKWFLP